MNDDDLERVRRFIENTPEATSTEVIAQFDTIITSGPVEDDDTPDTAEAFEDAIAFFHGQLDRTLPDGVEGDTPREYLTDGRGWDDETIAEKQLGYAPPDSTGLLDHLMRRGYDPETIRGTGLFWGGSTPIWKGRIVFPYFEDGRPTFAISRTLDHPADDAGDYGGGPAKYHKISVSREDVKVEEPIYGLDSIQAGESVLITEGVADAITAHAAGYPCVSPVTTQFKDADRDRLVEALKDADVPRVYIVQDAEEPSSDVRDDGSIDVEQYGPGLRGAVATAGYLADAGIDAQIGELPRYGAEKVDLDNYLQEWTDGDLTAILASAKPANQHPAYEPDDGKRASPTETRATLPSSGRDGPSIQGSETRSGLFSLDIGDLTGLAPGERADNPLGHHGNSHGYLVVSDDGETAYEHKYKVTYTALTFLLADAGERSAKQPEGSLSDRELFMAWRHAKGLGAIPADDPIPHRALVHVATNTGLCEREDVEDGWKLPIDAYNAGLETVHDEYGLNTGRPTLSSGHSAIEGNGGATDPARFVEECEPPTTADAEPIDVDTRREEMVGELYDRFGEHDGLTVWAHNPGEGKTTSAPIGAAERNYSHVVALPKHENCREFQKDDVKPGEYFHLKGAAQPAGDTCMDAKIGGETVDCPEHGHQSNCPSMCPVYDLDADHPVRQRFDLLAGHCGVFKAHQILRLNNEEWHGKTCPWLEQWDAVENTERIVTVGDYLTLVTIREHGDILLDDVGGFVAESTTSIEDLTRCQKAMQRFARYAPDERTADTFRLLDGFIDRLLDALTGDAPGKFNEVNVPTFPATARIYNTYEAVPKHVPDDAITETRRKEYVGDGGQYVYERAVEVETTDLAETLARAKLLYDETVINRIQDGEWTGTPLCLDAVFGALAAALDDKHAARDARIAAGFDATLDTCPRCGTNTEPMNGARICPECSWHEEHSRLMQDHTPPARIDVDVATTSSGTVDGLAVRGLPDVAALPDPKDVLVLDATPRTDVYGAIFGVDPETIAVHGADPYVLPNVTVTQFVDGAYHRSTIEQSPVARQRIQRSVEKIDAMHEDVVYVSARKVRHLFDWPGTNANDVLYYYALRGLDTRRDADAIVLVGAPHPDENDLRAEARLLSIDNPTVRAGGRELSTRDDEATGPPNDRKLNYQDDDGKGRAVAAKTYSGITGDLFDSRHSDELEQAAHRVRPILATEDAPKHVYLLTNVPTQLPVDHLTTYDDFLDPLAGAVDVRDSALELLDVMVESAQNTDNDAPYVTDGGIMSVAGTMGEWIDAAERGGMDVTDRTVRNALSDLRDAGIVEEGDYAQRRGRLQTLTQFGASIASVSR